MDDLANHFKINLDLYGLKEGAKIKKESNKIFDITFFYI